MPYLVKQDGTTVIEAVSKRYSPRFPDREVWLTTAHVHKEGDVITYDIYPPLEEKWDDEGKDAPVKKISKKEAEKLGGSNVTDLASVFQAEGGGELDEPRKIQTALTGPDLEDEAKKEVQEAKVDESKSDDK
jgi:hypothetical protein